MASISIARGVSLQSFRVVKAQDFYVNAVAVYHVTWDSSPDPPDPSIVFTGAGVPKIGDPFTTKINGPALFGFNELRCEEQEVAVLGTQNDGETVFEVTCRFAHWPLTPVLRSGGAGLQQITTQKLRDGTQVLVSYNGRQQGGELNVFKPTTGVEIEVVEPTSTPDELAASWINTVNSQTFAGEPPRTWKIVDISYDRVAEDVYFFRYRFENDPEGWDPTGVYVDPETVEFPPDLIVGEGIKTFEYDDARSFTSLFTTRILP